ncbi:aldehyde reductase [Mycolicibacterium sp. 120266]|uniref:SDR family oxidoreductase n=1 Tax=Mycolicibacterium sp. 120266 TaxID=3090601 RepID=UPI00299E5BDB|nr:aldehyde reductase [Mycolicibacterium sp. 120266]MDX1872589.1 aldehyde reductase [Mycolicibacterium sp. 120266]
MNDDKQPVLVTGGSGFLAGHTITQLLAAGHPVRTTVRTAARIAQVRDTLARAGADTHQLSFAVADLAGDAGWADAVAGCGYVLHMASPFPPRQPENPDELIAPAREGTLRVLRAAAAGGVRRVVLTSSFAAVGYSPRPSGWVFDEADWTDTADENSPYVLSKTFAERAAWEFAADHPGAAELAVINPVGVFGPVLGPQLSSSVGIIAALLRGRPTPLPRASFAVVDVRDVADLHVRAMTAPGAAGQRYLASAGEAVTLPQIAATLRERLGARAARVPEQVADDDEFRAAAAQRPELEVFAGLLGEPKKISRAKAAAELDWCPRSAADAVTATAESLLTPSWS